MTRLNLRGKSRFQSTLPREERPSYWTFEIIMYSFQSTLPREERRFTPEDLQKSHYFNPRSHERSDDGTGCSQCSREISIHAPTRGATDKLIAKGVPDKISIHAPTRGATTFVHSVLKGGYFNPRSHERSDQVQQQKRVKALYFNPRSHERSDLKQLEALKLKLQFQSTLPREERQQYCTKNLFIFIQYRQ